MKKILILGSIVLGLMTTASYGQTLNLEERKIGSVNSQEFKMTSYTARKVGNGCEGAQGFEGNGFTGISKRIWKKAVAKDGGILCTEGTWYMNDTGAAGGSYPDLFIKGGKFYRVK